MLCETCKKLSFNDSPSAAAQSIVMGFRGRRVKHEFEGKWFPGNSRKELEDWCAKNCKEVKEEITPPTPLKDTWVQSSNKNLKPTDKKKD